MNNEDVALLRQAAQHGLLRDLAGTRFQLTGAMSVPRKDMTALIEACGGRVVTKIGPGARLDYLVVGDTGWHGNTRKITAAQQQGTNVIKENDFVDLLSNVGAAS